MKKARTHMNQSGAVLVLVALLLVVIFGVAAFAIDIGHLTLVRNELRNAADAGALAGAKMLYSDFTGTQFTINTGADAIASAAATANGSDGSAVEVLAVERGHWCFSCVQPDGITPGVFTANSAGSFGMTTTDYAVLDTDPNFINAVRVVTGRGPTLQAASFFAGIFGRSGFTLNAESVAWRGFAGNGINADEPIAICHEAIYNGDELNCTVGKMINDTTDTGSWTDLNQGSCSGASSPPDVSPLICRVGGISDKVLNYGQPMDVINGQVETLFSDIRPCWSSASRFNSEVLYSGGAPYDSDGDGKLDEYHVWSIKLPMVDCAPGSSPNCKTLIGAVQVDVFWITQNGNDPKFKDIPPQWINPDTPDVVYSCPQAALDNKDDSSGRKQCWKNLLDSFGVKNANGDALSSIDEAANLHTPNTLFFKPSCSLAEIGAPDGVAGYMPSQFPRLVK